MRPLLNTIVLCALATALLAQNAPYGSATTSAQGTASDSSSSNNPASGNPYLGSVPTGKVSSEPLALTLQDALARGLKQNLGALLASRATQSARGQRWKDLSDLLPNLTSRTSESLQKDNLAARGINFPHLPNFPSIPSVVGPFSVFDTRGYLTQSIFDWKAIEKARADNASVQAAEHAYKDARDLVVLAVGNAYLQAIAASARLETAQSQVATAQALYDKAEDQRSAGLSPAIDALRAKVELQTRQQELIVAQNQVAQQKLGLARSIGLPLGQEFTLADQAPYEPLAAMSVEEALQRAYQNRSDYQSAGLQLRAAGLARKSAFAGYFPSISFTGDYGDIGIAPGNAIPTFQVAGTLKVPIFEGGKTHGEVLQADARLQQSKDQLDDLKGRIDYEVRIALLNLKAAAEQVAVARSNVDLAAQTLEQAQDRFSAGVTDNIEVIQAQETVAAANESYISSLYQHNLAKVNLARVLGFAEAGIREYWKGK